MPETGAENNTYIFYYVTKVEKRNSLGGAVLGVPVLGPIPEILLAHLWLHPEYTLLRNMVPSG